MTAISPISIHSNSETIFKKNERSLAYIFRALEYYGKSNIIEFLTIEDLSALSKISYTRSYTSHRFTEKIKRQEKEKLIVDVSLKAIEHWITNYAKTKFKEASFGWIGSSDLDWAIHRKTATDVNAYVSLNDFPSGLSSHKIMDCAYDIKRKQIVVISEGEGSIDPIREKNNLVSRIKGAQIPLEHISYSSSKGVQHAVTVSEWQPLGDLSAFLDLGLMNRPHHIRFAIEMASVVLQMHQRGVIWSDIKPENFLVSCDKDCSVPLAIDFEYCVRNGDRRMGGTINYTPPECCQAIISGKDAHFKMDHSYDVWSLGIAFYVMITKNDPLFFTMKRGKMLKSICALHDRSNWERAFPFCVSHCGFPEMALVRNMLQFDPKARPDIKSVYRELIAIRDQEIRKLTDAAFKRAIKKT